MGNRPLAPGFLKRLDDRWLKKHPILWSSRILWVFYYGSLIMLLISLISVFVYTPVMSRQSVYTGNLLITIISIISCVFWVIYLLRFNPFKRFSFETKLDGLKVFLLYLTGFLFIFSWAFIPQMASYTGVMGRFSTDEMNDDFKRLNYYIAGEVFHKNP